MQLITSRTELIRHIRLTKPTYVAVAYVGKAWEELLALPTGHLKTMEIVLSPTLGSNPDAIEEICKRVGWDRVYFLEQLHAKVYIGPEKVIVGSANLSSNALGTGGSDLFEMVVVTDDVGIRQRAITEFGRYRDIARSEYKTRQQKEERIKYLRKAAKPLKQARELVENTRPAPPPFSGFKIGSVPVRLEWWSEDDPDVGEEMDHEAMNVRLDGDNVRAGDWMLCWKGEEQTGRPGRGFSLCWMRIDEVRPGRGDGEQYVDQVAQTHRALPRTEPFQIDTRFKRLFKQEVVKAEGRSGIDSEPMRFPSRQSVESLLNSIRKRYLQELRSAD